MQRVIAHVLPRASTLIPRVHAFVACVCCAAARVSMLGGSSFVKKGHRNVPEENFTEAFDSLDADHDGTVTKVRCFCTPSQLSLAHLPCHDAPAAQCTWGRVLSSPPVECLCVLCVREGSTDTSWDAH